MREERGRRKREADAVKAAARAEARETELARREAMEAARRKVAKATAYREARLCELLALVMRVWSSYGASCVSRRRDAERRGRRLRTTALKRAPFAAGWRIRVDAVATT